MTVISFQKFFQQAKEKPELNEKLRHEKVVFFLHLLGIDTNGHVNKPYSRLEFTGNC